MPQQSQIIDLIEISDQRIKVTADLEARSRHQRPPRPRSPTPTRPGPGHHAPSPARRPPLGPQAQRSTASAWFCSTARGYHETKSVELDFKRRFCA